MRHFLLFICILLLPCGLCAQDVILTDLSPQAGPLRTNHLEMVSLFNASELEIMGALQVSVLDINGSVIVENQSFHQSIPAGGQISMNDIWWNLLQPASGHPLGSRFIATGNLEAGEYTLCFVFIDDSGEVRGTACRERTSNIATRLELIYPYDGDTIMTANPVLSWERAVGFFQDNSQLSYELRLTEMMDGQSQIQALEQNVPYFISEPLPVNSLLYPLGVPELLLGKWYAWQITVLNGPDVVVESPVWRFTVGSVASGPMPDKTGSYTMANTRLNNRYVSVNENIYLGFDNNEQMRELRYSIRNVNDGDWIAEDLPDLPDLIVGLNTIDIPTKDIGLVKNKLYELAFVTPRGQQYYLQFKYQPSAN